MSAASKPDKGVTGELAQDAERGQWFAPIGRSLMWAAERIGAFLGPNTALVLTLAIGMGIVVALSALAEEVYEAVAEADGVAVLDRPLLDLAKDLRSPTVNTIITLYTDLAGTTVMPVIAVVALLILSIRRRSWTPAILIASAGLGSLLMTIVGKRLIGRTRPSLSEAVAPFETSPSFPSGHTLNAVVVIGVIVYLLILRRESNRAKVLLIAGAVFFAVTVGLSRVFLGHHWFTDVAAGWVLGAAWLALVITAHRLYLALRARGRVPGSRVAPMTGSAPTSDLSGWVRAPFSGAGMTYDCFEKGSGPGVVLIPEIPGITPQVLGLAEHLVESGFTVVVPSPFGEPGRDQTMGYMLGVVARMCVSSEFRAFAVGVHRPITDYFRAVASELAARTGGGVGVIGMCFTGGFALAVAVDDAVTASVLSQPGLPFPISRARRLDPTASPAEFDRVAERANAGEVCALGLRFSEDAGVPRERFATIKAKLGDAFEVIELDSSTGNSGGFSRGAHSVLTNELRDQPRHPALEARERVVAFLTERLS